jgi:hypothetical protein
MKPSVKSILPRKRRSAAGRNIPLTTAINLDART